MGVGDENMVDGFDGNLHLVQDAQDAVAAAGVHHEILVFVPQSEAGIIAAGHQGVPRPEHIQFFHNNLHPFFFQKSMIYYWKGFRESAASHTYGTIEMTETQYKKGAGTL